MICSVCSDRGNWKRARRSGILRIANRTTFFLARQAFGADGYRSGDRFYMWNQISDTVSVSTQPHFEPGNVLLRDSSESREVIARIRRQVAFGQVWLEKLSETKAAAHQ